MRQVCVIATHGLAYGPKFRGCPTFDTPGCRAGGEPAPAVPEKEHDPWT